MLSASEIRMELMLYPDLATRQIPIAVYTVLDS